MRIRATESKTKSPPSMLLIFVALTVKIWQYKHRAKGFQATMAFDPFSASSFDGVALCLLYIYLVV